MSELPTLYQQFIHKSRYARWLEKEGRRETWDETVTRYLDFFEVEASKTPQGAKAFKKVRPQLYRNITGLHVMPSMRAMMTAGPALRRDAMAGFNCLGAETLVTTKEYGIVPISTLAGKSVHVVDGNGDWTLSKCKSYGKQRLGPVEFGTSGGGSFRVRATAGHRWILKSGEERLTQELIKGARLATVAIPPRPTIDVESEDYRLGVVHGLIYGDGTAQYKQHSHGSPVAADKLCKGFVIRLCSDQADLLPYFGEAPRSYPPSFRGQPVVYQFGGAVDLKSLPDYETGFFTDSYLMGFVRGWNAADGTITKAGQVSLAATKPGVNWLMAVGPRLGFVPRNTSQYPGETNLGVRKSPLFRVDFDRRYLVKEDLIIARKQQRFIPIDPVKNPHQAKISNRGPVGMTSSPEEVFCFEVPTTRSFLLTKGILTGNCAYVAIDHPRAFDESMYVLMCGTGVGYSVERQSISKLPEVSEEFHDTSTTITVHDSKIGWAKALREFISLLYAGQVPTWDVSGIRPAGARLKTFGGRASGPAPLVRLFEFAVSTFKGSAGRRLTSIECHDLMCMIADTVVVGGVRRSAMICLSNLSDDRMRNAKSGRWHETNPHRQLANNSAVYTERPDMQIFLEEWKALYESHAGERGIFNRQGVKRIVESLGKRDANYEFGCNPCSEIILRSMGVCNLSEAVIRNGDSLATLKRKVRIAAILGTLQATQTNFRYVRKGWVRNAEEERLLGVSLTGLMDHEILSNVTDKSREWLCSLRKVVVDTNKKWAKLLGIPAAAATTAVKPSGCRPADALVTTDAGILTLAELMAHHPADKSWSSAPEQLNALQIHNTDKITKTFRNGTAETIKVKLSYNMEVISTPNHRWFVKQRYNRTRKQNYEDVGRWVPAEDLTPGDILDVSLGAYNSKSEANLKVVPQPPNVKHVGSKYQTLTQPAVMTPDLAWLLGYYWGDGCLSASKSRLRFIDQNKHHLERVQRSLKDLFNLDASIHKASQGRDAWVLERGSTHLYSWFLANGLAKQAEDMSIPRIVRESSAESILAFFAGLVDSDGCVSKTSNGSHVVTLSTAYSTLAKSIQDVGAAVGLVFGRSLNTQGQNLQKTKHMWLLSSAAIQTPQAFARLVKYSIKASTVSLWRHEIAKHSLILGKVTSIAAGPTVPTFDVEVENSHWYYAGAVKSHNTVSQLVDCSSGLHARYAAQYIRTVRGDKKDPLSDFMISKGIPHEDAIGKPEVAVFSFPIKSPQFAVTEGQRSALEQLEYWKMLQESWCEHKPSCTVYYREDEFLGIGSWIYQNFASISGISFLPYEDHIYQQAPYSPITPAEYTAQLAKLPKSVDWTELSDFEQTDSTTGAQTYACSGGVCEVVDLT